MSACVVAALCAENPILLNTNSEIDKIEIVVRLFISCQHIFPGNAMSTGGSAISLDSKASPSKRKILLTQPAKRKVDAERLSLAELAGQFTE